MASEEAKGGKPVKAVQLEGQVILKIMQHCNEALPQLVTGQLLGLDVGQVLEVTDCFAFPVRNRSSKKMGALPAIVCSQHGF